VSADDIWWSASAPINELRATLSHPKATFGSARNVNNGWFADIRTRFLRELSGCYAKGGTATRKS
jgi:hypothetical protein